MEQVFQKLHVFVLFDKVGDHKARGRALAVSAHAAGLPQRALAAHIDDATEHIEARVPMGLRLLSW